MLHRLLLTIIVSAAAILPAGAIEKPGVVYKVFQFPADKIPRIDDNVEHIEFDTFKPARNGVLPLALTDVRALGWRDTDLKVVADKCVELQAGGSPFQATATIANGPEDGLTNIQVSVDGQSQTRWVAMRTNERKAVAFTGWNQPGPGLHTVQCGELEKQVRVP